MGNRRVKVALIAAAIASSSHSFVIENPKLTNKSWGASREDWKGKGKRKMSKPC